MVRFHRGSPRDLALDFIESLGDAGLCSIEARGLDATRAIYDTILGKA